MSDEIQDERCPDCHASDKPLKDPLLALLADLTDSDDCWFDHHGYCQAHLWFRTEPSCPHTRAKAILNANGGDA